MRNNESLVSKRAPRTSSSRDVLLEGLSEALKDSALLNVAGGSGLSDDKGILGTESICHAVFLLQQGSVLTHREIAPQA
jgi:hypothetical protein